MTNKMTDAKRTLIEYRNDRRLAEILAVKTIEQAINQATTEQMIALYQFIDPISATDRAELDKMTDQELLDALQTA